MGFFLTCTPALRLPSIPKPSYYAACPPYSIRLVSIVIFLILKPFRFVLVVNFFLFCYFDRRSPLAFPIPLLGPRALASGEQLPRASRLWRGSQLWQEQTCNGGVVAVVA